MGNDQGWLRSPVGLVRVPGLVKTVVERLHVFE